ncbi:MAG: hypothetical protein KKD07_06710, partial [Candidatus Omnitrophica bacterium]|nr:hypothetical protein [Candidatus Omnitrophota bacterium]
LTKESIATNSLIAKQKEKINQLESSVDKYKDLSEIADDLKNKNDEANALITDYAEKISSLEGQITFTKGSLDEYKSSIQTRIKQLEDEKIKFDEKQKHLMDELSNMEMVKDENNVLKEALNSLESDLVVVKQEYLQKSKESDLKIEMFDKGKEELLRNILETELNLNKLKEYNAYLLTKEKVLQYELTKNRAKALGFEKICEDFKRRIDNEERPAEIEGIFN